MLFISSSGRRYVPLLLVQVEKMWLARRGLIEDW